MQKSVSALTGKTRRFLLPVLFVLLLFVQPAGAKEYYLEDWGCFLDMPQGWEPLEVTDTKATFSDTAQKGFLQIKVYPPEQFSTGDEFFSFIGELLKADMEGESFLYQGEDSVFASLIFAVNDTPYQGFAFLVNGKDQDWAVLSFAEMAVYEPYQYFLLSALDSLSLSSRGLLSPGPVSRFYEVSFENPDWFDISLPFARGALVFETDGNAVEAAEVLVEREAAVLARYKPEDTDAWSRYYRMIYRDNYRRTDGLFRSLLAMGLRTSADPGIIARELLSWLQDFDYARTGTPSDFAPPLSVMVNRAGDCDSLGLLYVILLKHYGIDSILMVSSRYAHALAAVDVPGAGARFSFEGKDYLIAETTDQVDLGMISASMADPAGWLGIGFRN